DNCHDFLFGGWRNDVGFNADAGVHRAGVALDYISGESGDAAAEHAGVLFVQAVEALDVGTNFLTLAETGLVAPFGIGNDGAGHGYGVTVTFGDHAFGVFRIGDAAHDDDGNLDAVLLGLDAHVFVGAFRHEFGGEH